MGSRGRQQVQICTSEGLLCAGPFSEKVHWPPGHQILTYMSSSSFPSPFLSSYFFPPLPSPLLPSLTLFSSSSSPEKALLLNNLSRHNLLECLGSSYTVPSGCGQGCTENWTPGHWALPSSSAQKGHASQTHLFLPFLSLLTWLEHPGFYILSCDWVCPHPQSLSSSLQMMTLGTISSGKPPQVT